MQRVVIPTLRRYRLWHLLVASMILACVGCWIVLELASSTSLTTAGAALTVVESVRYGKDVLPSTSPSHHHQEEGGQLKRARLPPRFFSMREMRSRVPRAAPLIQCHNKSFKSPFHFERYTSADHYKQASHTQVNWTADRELFERLTAWQSPSPTKVKGYFGSRACQGTAGSNRMRSFYDERKLYILENFCIGPDGGVSGFNPQLVPYQSGTDLIWAQSSAANQSQIDVEEFRELFRRVAPLAKPPACIIDAPLLIYPVSSAYNNVGHDFYRIGSLLRIRELAFDPDEHVALLKLYSPLGLRRLYPEYVMDASGIFREFLGPLQFGAVSVNASRNGFAKQVEELRQASRHDLDDARVCFRRGVVWHNAIDNISNKMPQASSNSVPGYQVQYSLYGPRSHIDQLVTEKLRRQLAQCASLRLRSEPDRRSPRILFAMRSMNRNKFVDHDATLQSLKRFVESMNATLDVVEHVREDDANSMLQRYADADAIYGPYGAGLIWSFLAPPGSVLGYASTSQWGSTCGKTGINVCSNTDYSGQAFSSRQHHVELRVPDKLLLHRDEDVLLGTPHTMHLEVLRVMMCLLRYEKGQGSVPPDPPPTASAADQGHPLCEFNHSLLDVTSHEHLHDDAGNLMKRIAQSLQSKAARASPRREVSNSIATVLTFNWAISAAALLADVLRPFRAGGVPSRCLEIISSVSSCASRVRLGWHRLLFHYSRQPLAFVMSSQSCDQEKIDEVEEHHGDELGDVFEDGDPVPALADFKAAVAVSPNILMVEADRNSSVTVATAVRVAMNVSCWSNSSNYCVMLIVGADVRCTSDLLEPLVGDATKSVRCRVTALQDCTILW